MTIAMNEASPAFSDARDALLQYDIGQKSSVNIVLEFSLY